MVQKLNCCWDRYCQIYSTKGRNLFTLNSISSFSLCLSRIMPRLRSRLWWAERSSPSSSCLRTAAAQSGRTRQKKKKKKLPEFVFVCLRVCLSVANISAAPITETAPSNAGLKARPEEWHRRCLKGRRWSTCLSGTAGSTGSGGSSSASAERKRSSSR